MLLPGCETWVAGSVLGLLFGVLLAFGLRTAIGGRKISARVAAEGGTMLLGQFPMEAFHWVMRGLGRLAVKARIAPDTLTFTSLLITLACIPFIARGHFATGATVFFLGSMFDAFDGIVARELGVSSDAGEVLDATIDRYADAAPLIGLAVFYRASEWQMVVPLVALMGSMMVSYSRAKAEAMRVSLAPGLMRRHERIAYLGVALLVGPLLSPLLPELEGIVQLPTIVIVGFVAVMSNVAAALLIRETRVRLRQSGRGPGGNS